MMGEACLRRAVLRRVSVRVCVRVAGVGGARPAAGGPLTPLFLTRCRQPTAAAAAARESEAGARAAEAMPAADADARGQRCFGRRGGLCARELGRALQLRRAVR